MKKFLLAAIVGLTILFAVAQTQAAYPPRDTWVLRWDGTDLYVKAGSLNYTPSHVDAAPEFSFVLAFDGATFPCEFSARGYAVLYINGQAVGDSKSDNFVDALYAAICDKLIYRR